MMKISIIIFSGALWRPVSQNTFSSVCNKAVNQSCDRISSRQGVNAPLALKTDTKRARMGIGAGKHEMSHD